MSKETKNLLDFLIKTTLAALITEIISKLLE